MVGVFRDYLGGLTAEESAGRLDVSANTVRRDREGLRDSLAKWFRLELDAVDGEPPGTSPDRAVEP